ncbi:hypothetical protein MMC30_001840 [Trapelia coarctata]|nr:hypothetical protein [Trapelia coarctata]
MSIGSLITPTTRGFPQQDQVWPDHYQNSFTGMPRGPYAPELVYGLSVSDDSPLYSSDSNYSPISETPHSHVHAQPYLPQYGKPVTSSGTYPTEYHMNMITPLSVAGNFGSWPAHEENAPPIEGLGIGFEGQYPHPVGISISASKTHEQPVDSLADSSTPTTLTFLERDGGAGIRAHQSFAAGLVASKNGLVTLDHETLQHYRDCYWKYFHPQFAVVHRPTMETGSFLDTVILAIGAQYSSRPQARSHSHSWFTYASRSCATLDPATITSESELDSLRVIVLLEILGLYRWKSPGVYKSAHFAALYISLLNDHTCLSTDPTAYVQSLPTNADQTLLQTAYTYWIDLESRRRLLLAAFILNTHRSTLFHQPPCHPNPPQGPTLPVASPSSTWESADLPTWLASISQPRRPISEISPFTTSVLQCLNIVAPVSPSHYGLVQNSTAHALLMATYTPIQPLLTIAAESWLFARKVEDPMHWTAAKTRLRAWVESDDASRAVWHAGHYLRAHLNNTNNNSNSDHADFLGLHTSWCLYLAALICWAYGFSPEPHFRNQGLEAQRYLAAVNVPSWKELESMRGGGATREVLKYVRALLARGSGALVAEGESVLGRLVEGRGRLCWF